MTSLNNYCLIEIITKYFISSELSKGVIYHVPIYGKQHFLVSVMTLTVAKKIPRVLRGIF